MDTGTTLARMPHQPTGNLPLSVVFDSGLLAGPIREYRQGHDATGEP